MKCIKWLNDFCVANDIISAENAAWFQYGIERRLTNILIGVPFFILAVILTNFSTSVAFFLSFYYLRCQINGFHSKSVLGCLITSLMCESFFLSVFHCTLTQANLLLVNASSIVLVFLLAPFKDSSFHLSSAEYQAIKKSSRMRVLVLSITTGILSILGVIEFAKGITTGIAMATFLLGLAYILNGGKTHGQTAEKSTEIPAYLSNPND